GALEETLHGVEGAALIDLEVGVEIVGQSEIGIEAQGGLEGFVSGTQTFEGAFVVFVPEPAGAAESGPSGCVGRIEADAAIVDSHGCGEIVPLATELVGLEVKLVHGWIRGSVLPQGLVLARGERRENGVEDAADQVVVKFE